MHNTIGRLVRWTHDDGTVYNTLAELLAVRSPRNLRGEVDMQYMEVLADVAEHWGQRCTLLAVHREDTPPSYEVQFDDGYVLFAILGDVVFD